MELLDPKHFLFEIFAVMHRASQGNELAFLPMFLALLACGVVYAFFGVRMYRLTLSMLGFSAGALGVIILFRSLPPDLIQSEGLRLSLLVIGGGIVAFLAPKLLTLSSFLLGGSAIAMTLHPMAKLMNPPSYGYLLLLLGFAAGGFLALLLVRPLMIFATSVIGTYLLLVSAFSAALFLQWITKDFPFFVFQLLWLVIAFFCILHQFQRHLHHPPTALPR